MMQQTSFTGKQEKWLRFLGVMTLKQYGARITAILFYTLLVSEVLTSTKDIWRDFKQYSDCNNEYTANLTREVSQQYSESTDYVAAALMATTECLASTVEVDIGGFGLGIGDRLGDVFGDIFGWFTPGQGIIPIAELDLQSNSDKIMQDIADDLSFLDNIVLCVRLVGFLMTFVILVLMIVQVTYYTVEDIPWTPGTVGLLFRLLEIFQVVVMYGLALMAVVLQARLADKACQLNVKNAVIETPMCEVWGDECEFQCVTYTQSSSSPCTECDIRYGRWWPKPLSWPNIMLVLHLAFLIVGIPVELDEKLKSQRRHALAAAREESALRQSHPGAWDQGPSIIYQGFIEGDESRQ